MAKSVKMSDLEGWMAARVFEMLNPEIVKFRQSSNGFVIITDTEPKKIIYPEGWYYAKGTFRNKHNSSTGIYSEIIMRKSNGDFWSDCARYCTLNH